MNDEDEEKLCTDLATFLTNPIAGFTKFHLRFKRIGPQGGVAIGQSLQTNTSLLDVVSQEH